MTESSHFLSSAQAAARLGVKPATLYAYVSRGLVVRHRTPDGRRSLFDPADLARLERRSGARRGRPAEVVVASEVTLIDAEAGRLWFRGLDPVDACRHRRFEEISGWLWSGNFDGTGLWRADQRLVRTGERAQAALGRNASFADRLHLIAATVASIPSQRSGITAATELLTCLVDCLPGSAAPPGSRFATRLWTKLTTRKPTDELIGALDAGLSLTADHGLTYSALVARVVAATGGSIAAAVASALGAGVASVRASRFDAIEHAIAASVEHGPVHAADGLDADAVAAACSFVPYPSGDPRARPLLEMLDDESAAVVRGLLDELRARGAGPPTAVLAQAALSWASGMRPGSGEAISLVSRTAGWIAHALEEHRRPTPFRPRLAYTGPAPRTSTPIRMLDAVQGYLSRE